MSLGNAAVETCPEGCLDALVGAPLLQRLSGLLAHGLSGRFIGYHSRFVMGPGWFRFGGLAPPRGRGTAPGGRATFEAIALRRRPEPIRGCILE